jgi:hypothetical protein
VNVNGAQEAKKIIRKGFYLEQNYPNPFNKLTTIRFNLPYESKVTIIITNSFGRVVDKQISNSYEAGSYKFDFLAEGLPKGTYFCHVVADKFSDSREMELIK